MTRRALVCAPLLPEFDRERGSRRLFTLIELLCEAGWMVTFATSNARGGERYVDLLQQRGVETYTSMDRALERAIATQQFDVAILTFWYLAEQFLPKIRSLSPHTRVIVESVDLHFLRNARRVLHGLGEGQSPGTLDSAYATEMARELNAYAAADGVLAVSSKEAALVDDLAGGPNLAYLVPDTDDIELSTVEFEDRKGILFVGNFRHPPNVEAAEYLLGDIVPRLDPAVLAEHPLYIVGNALPDKLRGQHLVLPNVHMVGWVPSLLPYLHRARVTVVPLLHGAGTKGKVIQALMAGTPTVASSIGVEGLGIQGGEHALIADDPAAFAAHVTNLVRDENLWQQLAHAGRARMLESHGRQSVGAKFEQALSGVLARQPKKLRLADLVAATEGQPIDDDYARLVRRIAEIVDAELPAGARAVVISKGDDALLELGGVRARHFPCTPDGQYAGHHPADSAAAIAHLEAQRVAGAEFLILPRTSFWWLDYYGGFRLHLEREYPLVVSRPDTCLIFGLHPSTRKLALHSGAAVTEVSA